MTVNPLDPPYRLDPLQTITDIRWVEPFFQAGVGIRNFKQNVVDAVTVGPPVYNPHQGFHPLVASPPEPPPPNDPYGPEDMNPPPGLTLFDDITINGSWFVSCEMYDALENGQFVGNPADNITKRNNPEISWSPHNFIAPDATVLNWFGENFFPNPFIPGSTAPLVVNGKTIVGYLDTLEYTVPQIWHMGTPCIFWQSAAGGPGGTVNGFFDYNVVDANGDAMYGPGNGNQNPYWVSLPGINFGVPPGDPLPYGTMFTISVTISSAPFEYVATINDESRTIYEVQPPVWYQAKGILDSTRRWSSDKTSPDYAPGFIEHGNVYCVRVKKPRS
jgi:hypothetical protein